MRVESSRKKGFVKTEAEDDGAGNLVRAGDKTQPYSGVRGEPWFAKCLVVSSGSTPCPFRTIKILAHIQMLFWAAGLEYWRSLKCNPRRHS